MTSFAQKKKTQEKDVIGIVTFGLIGLLPTNHIIAYITMAYTGPDYPRKLTALLFMCTKRLVQFVPYNVTVSSTVPGAGGGVL